MAEDAKPKDDHYGFRLADVEDDRARKAYELWGGGRKRDWRKRGA